MRKQGLLERVRGWGSYSEPETPSQRTETIKTSIRNHLENILNTRQGSVLLDSKYGYPQEVELFEHFVLGNKPELIAALTRTILYYEPRISKLTIKDVQIDPYQQSVLCDMIARVDSSLAGELCFTTVITRYGKVIVRL